MTDLHTAAKLALEALELEDMACRYEKEPTPEHIAKTIIALRQALEQPAQQEPVAVLPDGSAFSIASYPLPETHWLYAPRQYMPGHEEPIELPTPVTNHADRDRVIAAIRYAVRGATMCGKEMDFDPDALVQNAVYALCGSYTAEQASPQAREPEQTAQQQTWHHPECEGQCIACLIEREVEAAYGKQGLAYLRRHVSGGGIKEQS